MVSPRLDQLLAIEDSLGNRFANNPHPGVAVTFTPRFAGAPAAHGVSVSAATGQVTVAAPLPAGPPFLRNFIIDCTATQGATSFTRMIRIHVHPGITRHWVTPARLDVPVGVRNLRFSLMAEFTDGTVGDITNWGAFEAPTPQRDEIFALTDPAPRRPVLAWSSNSALIPVDVRTGVLTGGAVVAVGVQITATLDASLGQPARHALADGALAWSSTTPVTHIVGPLANMADADVQNFLILPDGFGSSAAEQAAFERLADNVIAKLRTKRPLTPWPELAHKMNFFRAWRASPEAGFTVLNEVQRFNKAPPNADAFEFEQPRAPGAGITPLSAMLHSVGLPVPADDPDGNPQASKTPIWTALYGAAALAHVGSYAATGDVNHPGWMDLNDRVVLNERATAFHMALGERPAAELGNESRAIGPNQLRHSVEDFEDFVNNLEDRPGHPIGAVWAIGGKDHGNVLILCRTLHFGGANGFRSLPANPLVRGRLPVIAMGNDSRHRIAANAGGNGFDNRPDAIPAVAGLNVWTRAAHEYAHSMRLEDEYGNHRGTPFPDTATNRTRADRHANVQMRHSLLVAGNLEGGGIKWRWPRIRRAGVLAGAPAPLGGNRFRLTLQPKHAKPFVATGDPKGRLADIVRLRGRDLLTGGAPSIRFTVIAKAGDTLDIDAVPPVGAFAAANFPAGSLVIAPRRAPDPNFAGNQLGDDLELVSVRARDRITASHNPLNAANNAAANRACTAQNVNPHLPTASSNWPAPPGAPNPPKYSSWIVGLYEGGIVHDCDVYHPTGVCLMRTKTFFIGASERSYQFCPVCRYAIVDLLDPTVHGAIDDLYQPRYPT